jgi:Uma2 family endonuclease
VRAQPMEPEDRLYTIEEYEQLPDDDDRYYGELVRGRIIREPRPGYGHGEKLLNLAAPLRQHVRRHRLGGVTIDSGWALLPDVATVRGPDISFIAKARIPREGLPQGFPRMAPDLAVEIVSPSNRAGDIRDKLSDYFEAGVRQVWVVYPRSRNGIGISIGPPKVRLAE